MSKNVSNLRFFTIILIFVGLMHYSLQRALLKYIMIIHSWQLSLGMGCSFLHLEFGSQSSKVTVTHPINGRVDFPLHQSILLTLYQCSVTHPYFHLLSMPCPVWSWTLLSLIQSTFPQQFCHTPGLLRYDSPFKLFVLEMHTPAGPVCLSATFCLCASLGFFVVVLLCYCLVLKWLCDGFLQLVGLFPWKFQDFFILGVYGQFGTELPKQGY